MISDCDGVPGQQSRCTLCNQRLRGQHSHPGQWKSELQDIPGTLADTGHDQMEEGFLSFDRLIDTVYFKNHLAEFTLDTPRALYMSLAQYGIGPVQQHTRFIEVIRESVWSRIEFEDELPPSFDALWRHWQRICWVANMWNQAASNQMRLLDLTQYG